MKFRLKADVTFDAHDIQQACVLLGTHIVLMSEPESESRPSPLKLAGGELIVMLDERFCPLYHNWSGAMIAVERATRAASEEFERGSVARGLQFIAEARKALAAASILAEGS